MPECAICGKKLGLDTPRVHLVQKGMDTWYCIDHWNTITDLEMELVDVKNKLSQLMAAVQRVETTLKELKIKIERRR